MNIRSIFFLVMIVGISNPCAMTLSAMSHGFSIEQKQVIAQYGASCGYHALKNVVYLLRDEDNGLMSKEVVDDLLGANGRWRQWIKQQRVFSNIPTSVRQQVKANFCIKKLISSPKPRYDAIKIDGYTEKEMDEFNNILCEMLRKRFDACSKSIEVSKSISIAVSDIQGTINNLICDTGTTSRDIKEFRKWLKEQELDTAIPSLSIQVNELHRSEIGDDLSAGEIENIIEREKQTGKGLLEDLPISVGLPNNAIQGIKQQFEKNPSYRHGFVLNTGGHWISLVVAKNKALIADSINGDHSSSYAVQTILQELGINLQREAGRAIQQSSINKKVDAQQNPSLLNNSSKVAEMVTLRDQMNDAVGFSNKNNSFFYFLYFSILPIISGTERIR